MSLSDSLPADPSPGYAEVHQPADYINMYGERDCVCGDPWTAEHEQWATDNGFYQPPPQPAAPAVTVDYGVPTPTQSAVGPGSCRVSDVAASHIRTVSANVAGWILALAAVAGGVLPANVQNGMRDALTATLAAVLSSGWYVAARWLERRQGPSWAAHVARLAGRWMLGGVVSQPVYATVGQVVRILAPGVAHRFPNAVVVTRTTAPSEDR